MTPVMQVMWYGIDEGKAACLSLCFERCSVKFLRDATNKFVHFIQVSQLMTTTTTMKNNCEQELKKMERQVTEKNEAIAELR